MRTLAIGLALTFSAASTAGCWGPLTSLASDDGDPRDFGYEPPPPECAADPDCAAFDTDTDACTRAACRYGKCVHELVRGTAECQCHGDDDCSDMERSCSTGTCTMHRCVRHIAPAGPAPEQTKGDCHTLRCDGENVFGTLEFDASDVPQENPCVVATCEETSVTTVDVAAGTACPGGVCFKGKCLACAPKDPTSCGGEGPNEPANDSGATPAQMQEHAPFCAFSSGSDIDWYTFHATDQAFSFDVLRFELWSTAASIELCVYAKCDNGQAPGGSGCSPTLAGPNGSLGCCWTGAPSTVAPSWDLRCANTGDDSGTIYASVRAPGASACETYAMIGGY